MKESNSWLTPTKASELLGCTSRAITNYINRGKLSATREDGKFYIDKSEFFRVFPQAHIKEQERNPQMQKQEMERMKLENTLIKEMSNMKDREIEFLKSQIESFNKKETQLIEAINSHTRLLEFKEVGMPKVIGNVSWWPFKKR
jgi:hypothetical protein